jgi:hypothetical protein
MEVENKVEAITSEIPKFSEKVSETARNTVDNATVVATKATDAVKEAIAPYTNSTGAIYGLILVIIIAGLTSYALFVLVSGVIFQQVRDSIDGTKIPILCNQRSKIPITRFSNSGNGQRRSYSFWIYINDMTKYYGLYKHVWHIGDETNIAAASPFIFLDKTENKMHVRFAATYGDSYTDTAISLENITNFNLFMQQGITIPYIPIQRWVHVAIVINENSNGGTITTYVDGDLSAIISSGETTDAGRTVNISNLNIDKKGDLYVGGNSNGVEGVGFSGLISRVVIYNYDLNQQDVYKEYNAGPIDGILAKLGLGAYGVRSPIYQIT